MITDTGYSRARSMVGSPAGNTWMVKATRSATNRAWAGDS